MGRDLAAFFAQGVFVKQVLGHAVLGSTHAAQVGHPVSQLFDGFHLLVQEMCLKMIAQLKNKRHINLETHKPTRSLKGILSHSDTLESVWILFTC